MPKKRSFAFFISAMLLISAATLYASLAPQAQAKFAAPDGGCWCTTYVANYYHLPSTYPNANRWADWLQRFGWQRDGIPHIGDIEVLQPKIAGVNKLYGHVGVVRTAERLDEQRWRVTLRGAYQKIRPQFRDASCRNVSDWTSTQSIGSHSGVSYFYKLGVSR